MAAEPTLFDEASLALIASGGAGKDGVVYSVKPVPVYGSELIANGDFATDSDWTKSNATISGGTGNLNGTGVTSLLYQPILVGNKPYKANFTVSNYNGVGQAAVVDSDGNILYTITGNENKTIYFTQSAAANSNFFFRAINNAIYSIDNVSVQEVISDNGDFTFSRGSNLSATRVNASQLIEKGRENLFLQSNNFGTTWVKTSTTIASDVITGPLGELADSATPTATNAQHRVLQVPVSTGMGTFSMYIKQGELSRIVIHLLGVNKGRGFDCSDNTTFGAVGIAADAEYYAITDAGNGWSKIEVFAGGVTTRVDIYIANPIAGGNNSVWLGDGVSKIYISSAQFELGLAATPYIETGALTAQAGILEDTPRFDYSGGATCPSLLLEPSRTNIILYSEGMFDSEYSEVNGIVVAGQQVDLNGTNTAAKLSNFVNSSSRLDYTTAIAAVSGKTYTYSGYYKGSGNININVSSSTGVGGAGEKTITLTDEWVRHSITVTFNSSPTGNVKSHLAITRTPNNNAEVYLCFVQIEEGSYPTSYIPTYGVSQTRAVEVCGDAGDASTFNDNEGVLYVEIAALAPENSTTAISINDGTTSNAVQLFTTNTINQIRARVSNSTAQFLQDITLSDITNFNKIAIKYKQNDFALWLNGNEVATDTSGNTPLGLNNLSFDRGDGANDFNGKVKQVLVFKEALSDTELIKLTTI